MGAFQLAFTTDAISEAVSTQFLFRSKSKYGQLFFYVCYLYVVVYERFTFEECPPNVSIMVFMKAKVCVGLVLHKIAVATILG